LAGPERVLRHRRLHFGGPDGTRQHELRADAADRRHRIVRRRLPVRQARAAVVRHIPCARHLRAGGRHAAAAEAAFHRALDRRRPGSRGAQAGRAVRPADQPGQVAVLLHAGHHAGDLCRLDQPAALALGPRHDGDPRQRDRRVRHGRQRRTLQDAGVRRVRRHHRRRRRPQRDCGGVRRPRLLHDQPRHLA
ncbi:hypothetical protein KXV85_003331, partial [Aspergillus fumigatus]